MAYNVKLKCSDSVWDERKVETDEELFAVIGKFSMWYFLAIDSADYKDASNIGGSQAPDALLAFTCDKETDGPNQPHRHGLPTGMLAYGKAWPNGRAESAWLLVERQ